MPHPLRTVERTTLLAGLLLLLACGQGSDPGSPPPADPPRTDRPTAAATPAAVAVPGSAEFLGTVRYAGAPPKLRPLSMDADPGCAKQHAEPVGPDSFVLGEGQTLANVFVRVKSGLPEGRYPAPAEPVVLDQRGCRYRPHVLGILVDQPMKILNSDGLLHNVHALPKINTAFNRAMPAAVNEAEYRFAKEEFMFRIKCDVHPWMGAYVAVMSHPFFDVSGPDGSYSIRGLPAGTYEIEAWHEKLGLRSSSLTLEADGTATLDFSFTR